MLRGAASVLTAVLLVAIAGSGCRRGGERGPDTAAWRPAEGAELIGTAAPPWRNLVWLQGGPLELDQLRSDGKAVLVRFWLAGCPLCERTAPALVELHERYVRHGLVVVGIHHPKSSWTRRREVVAETVGRLGFDFPVAIDDGWATVRAYGVGSVLRSATSAAFLIDRSGTIRFVHDGGEFHAAGGPGHESCNAAYEALVAEIERALGLG